MGRKCAKVLPRNKRCVATLCAPGPRDGTAGDPGRAAAPPVPRRGLEPRQGEDTAWRESTRRRPASLHHRRGTARRLWTASRGPWQEVTSRVGTRRSEPGASGAPATSPVTRTTGPGPGSSSRRGAARATGADRWRRARGGGSASVAMSHFARRTGVMWGGWQRRRGAASFTAATQQRDGVLPREQSRMVW